MNRPEWAEAADRVYRFMMHSRRAEWGDHLWADWAMNIARWDWNSGVGIIAAAEYGEATGQERIMREVAWWVDGNERIAATPAARTINSMAPFAVFPQLYRATGAERYAERTRENAEWLMQHCPRTRSGAFEHTVTENVSFANRFGRIPCSWPCCFWRGRRGCCRTA